MSYVGSSAPLQSDPHNDSPLAGGLDRSLAFLGYGCLFCSVFFGGVPGVAAVLLAYVRKGSAEPVSRSHLRFQIALFWWSFAATVLAAVAGVAALVVGVTQLAQLTAAASEILAGGPWLFGPSAGWGLLLAAFGLFALAVAISWIGSLWGGLKLSANEPISRV